MMLTIGFCGKFKLPNYSKICSYIWSPNLSYSHIAYQGFMSISLDKWIVDETWKNHKNSVDYIVIQMYKKEDMPDVIRNSLCQKFDRGDFPSFIVVSLNEDAVSVDIRAFYRAVYMLASE